MKNKRFIMLLIALIALIALIFTVGFLAGRRTKPMDYSIPLPTQTAQTEEPNDDPVTAMPDNSGSPDKTIDPWETGSPNPTPSIPGPVATNPPVVKTTSKPTSAPHSPVYGQAFTLTIFRTNIPVSIGVDNDTLDKTPGWLETSAYPGKKVSALSMGTETAIIFRCLRISTLGIRSQSHLQMRQCLTILWSQ